jgi:hypothetical protein
MMRTSAVLGACLFASATSIAVGQTAVPASKMATIEAKTVTGQAPTEMIASKLVDESVYSPSDEKIGKIEYLIMNKNGKIEAVVIGVGGFLGIDKKDVALTFDSLSVAYESENSVRKIMANVTKDSLKAAPSYAYLKKS